MAAWLFGSAAPVLSASWGQNGDLKGQISKTRDCQVNRGFFVLKLKRKARYE
jgi:hypothetical protein